MAEAAPPEESTPVAELPVDVAVSPGDVTEVQGSDAPVSVETVDATPETPPTPEVEAPRQRTWNDVVDDYNNNRPLLPREVDAINNAREQQRVAAENARAEEERVTRLFPTQREKAIKEMATFMGISDLDSTEGMALRYKVENEIFAPLEKEARQAFTTPMLKTAGTQLWDALGRSREAHAAIQSLSPDKLIPFAIEVGRNLGATSPDVAPEAEVAKWQDGGKLDPKKFITVEQAEARLNKALDVERRAHNATPPPPVGSGRETSRSKPLSLAEIDAMPQRQWEALGDHETRLRILDAAHQAAGR